MARVFTESAHGESAARQGSAKTTWVDGAIVTSIWVIIGQQIAWMGGKGALPRGRDRSTNQARVKANVDPARLRHW
jgi:hypothetical protein